MESLIQIEMYNDPVDRIFFCLKQKIRPFLPKHSPKIFIYFYFLLIVDSLFYMYIRFTIICYMRPKKKEELTRKIVYIIND